MWVWEFLHPFKLTSTITTLTDTNSPGTENIISSSSKLGCYLTQAQTSRLSALQELLIVKLHFSSFLLPPAADCDVWFYFSHNQSLPAAAELPSKHILCSSCCLSFLLASWPCPRWSDFLLLCVRWSWPNNSLMVTKSEYPMDKCSLVFPVPICVLRVAIWRGILSTQQGEISAFYCFSQLCIVQSNLNFWKEIQF